MDKRTYLKLTLRLLQNMKDMKVSRLGFLLIIIEKPYIGATPDGLICCNCCTKGVLEVGVHFVLNTIPCCKSHIRDHAYFYQVQMQLYVYIIYNVVTLLCGLIKIYPLKELFQTDILFKILWTV